MKKIKPETASRNPGNSKGAKNADPELDFPDPINEHPASEPQNKSDIENPTSEINNNSAIDIPNSVVQTSSEIQMEVHHHPEVEKKGFKEYLLEGLMIFIAVMMGFFAESLREHVTENNRAADYAVTLYSDLKADTTELSSYITYFKPGVANTDTLLQLLSAADPKQIPTGKLYWYGLFGGSHRLFTPNDATLLEMENSGSLRFFGDKVISRKLAQYDQLCRDMKANDVNETEIYAEVRKARAQIFDFKYNFMANAIYQQMRKSNVNAKLDSFKKSNPPLLSYDKTLFNVYLEMVRSRYLIQKITRADTLMHRATELLGLLKKKYHVDGE